METYHIHYKLTERVSAKASSVKLLALKLPFILPPSLKCYNSARCHYKWKKRSRPRLSLWGHNSLPWTLSFLFLRCSKPVLVSLDHSFPWNSNVDIIQSGIFEIFIIFKLMTSQWKMLHFYWNFNMIWWIHVGLMYIGISIHVITDSFISVSLFLNLRPHSLLRLDISLS